MPPDSEALRPLLPPFRSRDFEGGAVPVSAIGGGFVGGLEELEQGGVGVGGLAQVFVGEDEFAKVFVEGSLCGCDGIVCVAGRLRVGVAVEEGFDAGCSWPEAGAADLMGVRVADDAVGEVGHAGVLGRGTAGEACAGEIERSPKEVDGTDLAAEAGAELGEDAGGLEEYAGEAVDVFRVVGVVGLVFSEGDGVGDFTWYGPDADGAVDAVEGGEDLVVEAGDGHGLEGDGATGAVARVDEKLVREEVEVDLEHARAVRHGQRGEAAGGGVEGDVPAVVEVRDEGETDFSDNLEPELEGGAGIGPRGLGESGPGFFGAGSGVGHGACGHDSAEWVFPVSRPLSGARSAQSAV